MIIYTQTLYGCTLDSFPSLAKAKKEITKREGYANIKTIRKANKEDIEWIRGMGGYVPPEPK